MEMICLKKNFLVEAFTYFKNASDEDPECFIARMNLGLVAFKLGKYKEGIKEIEMALALNVSNGLALLYLGMGYQLLNMNDEAHQYWDNTILNYTDIEREYKGIITSARHSIHVREYGLETEYMLDLLLYKEFSQMSISDYALLFPNAQNYFLDHKYIVVNNILHPFVLEAVQKCFEKRIERNLFPLGDPQSKRYISFNDRCARFIQYQLTDFVRKITAHNAKPSYTYFGGYVGGSNLKPHTDRNQCEFTLSLTLQNYPKNSIWVLSLNKNPIFEKNDEDRGYNSITFPKEEDIVDVTLRDGDGLLFMGRHLPHFRRGELKEGNKLNQVFLHYVREEFTGSLD